MEDRSLFANKGLVTNKDGGLFSWLFKNRDNDSSDEGLTDKEYEDKIKENYKHSLTKEVVVNADKLIGPDSYSVTRYPDDYSMLQKNFYKNFTDRKFKDKLQKNYGLSDSDYATVINTVYGLANSEIRADYGVGDTIKDIAKAVGVVDDDENSRGLMNIKFNTNSDALEGMGFKESDLDDDKKSLMVAASIIADRIKHLKKFKNFSNYNTEGKKLLASYAYKQGLSKINNDNLGEFMHFTGEGDNGYYLFPEESKTYDYFNEWLSAVGEKDNKKDNLTKEDIVPIKGMQSGGSYEWDDKHKQNKELNTPLGYDTNANGDYVKLNSANTFSNAVGNLGKYFFDINDKNLLESKYKPTKVTNKIYYKFNEETKKREPYVPDQKYYTRKGMKEDVFNDLTSDEVKKIYNHSDKFDDIFIALKNNGKDRKNNATNAFPKNKAGYKGMYNLGHGSFKGQFNFGRYTVDSGEDKNGRYISFIDRYDWNGMESNNKYPEFNENGINFYDRIYEDEWNNLLNKKVIDLSSIPSKQQGGLLNPITNLVLEGANNLSS